MASQGGNGYVEVEGGRLYYEGDGEGPAVVLLHAGIADHRMWRHQMDHFSREFRVVAYDLRGFGLSDPPTGPFSVVDDLARLMDALGLQRAALVGCSLGGAVDFEFVLTHPERVWAFVPIASGVRGFEWPPDPVLEEIDAAEASGDRGRATELSLSVWAPLRTDPETDDLIRRMAHETTAESDVPDEWWLLSEKPPADRLAEIAVPTLVVMGDHDHPKIFAIADTLVAGVPGARRVDITNADHLVPLRQPQAFNDAVVPFLRDAASGDG